MSDDKAETRTWLRRLRWSLGRLPASERDEIVAETEAHLREAIGAGASAADVLASFGRPEDYARQFIEQIDLASALASQDSAAMLSIVWRYALRSVAAASAAVALLGIATLALIAVAVLVAKMADPRRTGLWRGPHAFFVGVIDDPTSARDLLGGWLFPAAVVAVAICWLVGRQVLVWAIRAIAGSR